MNNKQQAYLKKEFENRVSFRLTERQLYGHDVGAFPSLIKPLVGDTTPDAVVQPNSEEEMVKLVRWAADNRIHLTPRGRATSGYGGVLPVKKGIVVDFYRMKHVINIDKANLTVTVESGMIWKKLEEELVPQGLMLKLYPSSAPGSTVGGWLAQGGAGIGSYEAGWFADNVTSARVVLADGTVKEFSAGELGPIADAEGITGLISQVTLRVQPLEELDFIAVSIPKALDLQQFVENLITSKLPVWSLVFINPKMAELKNKTPLMEHLGHPVGDRVNLPAAYIISLAFRKTDRLLFDVKLPGIVSTSHGAILSDEIAQHEWANRFKIMMVKRLGPSLVPMEIVVPLASIGKVLDEITEKITQPVVKEGVVIRNGADSKPEVVLLGFIPCDQRKFTYNFVYSLALSAFKIAEANGGRAYATGLYLTGKAEKILGSAHLEQIRQFKKETDPNNILNPGKILGGRLIGTMMNMAGVLEPLMRPFGNKVALEIGERPRKPVRGIPADVAWYAYGCSQCGYCIDDCDQFYGRGWESQSPRGKWYWLREYMEGNAKWDQFMVDSILACTTCELCNLRCSVSLPIEQSWMKLRGQLVHEQKRMTFPPFEMMAAALRKEGDIWAGYRKDRCTWFPEELKAKHGPEHKAKAVYFAGCTASYVEQDIGIASVRILDAAGIDFTFLGEKESCCGTPMMVAGKWEIFKETLAKNVRAVKESGADTVITSCPACDMMWRHVYPRWAKQMGLEFNIKAKHYSEVIAEKIRSGEFAFPRNNAGPCTVTWHDSCHMGRVSGVYEAPRELIQAIPGVNLVEMTHNRQSANCCGSVLTLIKDPLTAHEVGKVRLDEVKATGAEKVLALCPCCEFQLRVSADKKNLPIEVVDLARFAGAALGFKFPDPNPEVLKQWAVFEAMISLMTPEGFAALMGTMWPEMIDAMPFKMGPMMRVMGKIPGALNLMKPMFPVLFPRLLPMMMPKVMPVMLSRIAERVPMPDYMLEQMPELMPEVMDNLMPQMIGDVVPLVVQPMIDYLHQKKPVIAIQPG